MSQTKQEGKTIMKDVPGLVVQKKKDVPGVDLLCIYYFLLIRVNSPLFFYTNWTIVPHLVRASFFFQGQASIFVVLKLTSNGKMVYAQNLDQTKSLYENSNILLWYVQED